MSKGLPFKEMMSISRRLSLSQNILAYLNPEPFISREDFKPLQDISATQEANLCKILLELEDMMVDDVHEDTSAHGESI